MEQRGTRAVVQAVRIWYRYEMSDGCASGRKVGIPVAHGSMAYVGGSRVRSRQENSWRASEQRWELAES